MRGSGKFIHRSGHSRVAQEQDARGFIAAPLAPSIVPSIDAEEAGALGRRDYACQGARCCTIQLGSDASGLESCVLHHVVLDLC